MIQVVRFSPPILCKNMISYSQELVKFCLGSNWTLDLAGRIKEHKSLNVIYKKFPRAMSKILYDKIILPIWLAEDLRYTRKPKTISLNLTYFASCLREMVVASPFRRASQILETKGKINDAGMCLNHSVKMQSSQQFLASSKATNTNSVSSQASSLTKWLANRSRDLKSKEKSKNRTSHAQKKLRSKTRVIEIIKQRKEQNSACEYPWTELLLNANIISTVIPHTSMRPLFFEKRPFFKLRSLDHQKRYMRR